MPRDWDANEVPEAATRERIWNSLGQLEENTVGQCIHGLQRLWTLLVHFLGFVCWRDTHDRCSSMDGAGA